MAYSAPELLLVGAAQNLVLATSPDNLLTGICSGREKDDGNQYDDVGLW